MKNVSVSIKMLFVLSLLTGCLYPLSITIISHFFLFEKANGSIILSNGRMVGSELIGQNFHSEKYFHGRPSAVDYQTIPSGASNKAVTNKEFKTAVSSKYEKLVNMYQTKNIPQEIYLSSGSGLDPHISLQAALLQINRVMSARKIRAEEKHKIVNIVLHNVEMRTFDIMGEERVNVLRLNIALDSISFGD